MMDKSIYEKKLIDSVVSCIEKHDGGRYLSSIILTGSFGRGEPTYIYDEKGELMLKSDVEIALVVRDTSHKKSVDRLIQKVSSEFEENLNLMILNEKRVQKAYNFNFSLKVPKYKTIFTYDLFNGSRTIWGKDFISSKEVELKFVDVYEAKRLVANRIGELIFLQNTASTAQKEYLRKQWKGKLLLAIVSAWLICEGKYVSSYHGQYNAMRKEISRAEGVLEEGFFEQYKRTFLFLREEGYSYEIEDELLAKYVKNIDNYLRVKCCQAPKVNSISRRAKYFFKYVISGMDYGIIGFENNILQSLIEDYWNQSDRVNLDAFVWHRVLY